LEKGKKLYFASDVHLGLPNRQISLVREMRFVNWLESIRGDAAEIFLLGDIFDFWYEYRKVVPKGFTRFLGKLCEITDSGIPVHIFTGNHDVWMFGYLPEETGVILHTCPYEMEVNSKKFFLAHGDGLGPGDHKFKLLKRLFISPTAQWFFSRLHPNFAMWLGTTWSVKRRFYEGQVAPFRGLDHEWLALFAKEKLMQKHYDYFIFGHRHLPVNLPLAPNSQFVNLGDWISHFTYAEFDGNELNLKKFA
jgi:UDP-2,3-diacylglucosamine hydrolase